MRFAVQGLGTKLVVIVGFWGVFTVLYWIALPIEELLGTWITVRSEYRGVEQLSKFYIIVTLLVAVSAYRASQSSTDIKLSISFLLVALALYLGESDMIADQVQPLFGALFLGYALLLLLVGRAWLPLALLVLGCGGLLSGILSDAAHQGELLGTTVPRRVRAILAAAPDEELAEAVGSGFIGLAAMFRHRSLFQIVRRNTLGVVCLIAASGSIAMGVSLLAFVYAVRWVRELGFVIATLALVALVLTNKRLVSRIDRLALITEEQLYALAFVLLLLLPATYGRINIAMSLLLWLPAMFSLALYLYRRHPAMRRTETADVR